MGEDGGSADVQKIYIHWTFIKRAFVNLPQVNKLEGVFISRGRLFAEPLFLT
jgi:hypothetical protein